MTDADKDVLIELIKTTHEQLEKRERIAQAQQKRASSFARAIKIKEAEKNKRQKNWSVITAIGALIVAAVLGAFITSIWKDMNNMSAAMSDMQKNMAYMAHMEGMAKDMHAMNGSMGKMESSFATVKDDMGSIEHIMNDMNKKMTPSVVNMSKDVSLMRQGVQHMANDTDAMGKPFKTIDTFIPW